VPKKKLNPLIATTFGTGELIKAALDHGCRRFIIGIGGSATNDGGAGMAQTLGVKFLDDHGRELLWGGAALIRLKHIDTKDLDDRLNDCQIDVACDVTNPICGEYGASKTYGPQKGASECQCEELDKALVNYAEVIKEELGIDIIDIPGGGAAGGLGAGFVAFLKAKLISGIDIVSETVKLQEHLSGADLVFTGEGRIDSQTLFGKAVAGVADKANAQHIPVVVIAGAVNGDYQEFLRHGINAILSTMPGPISLEETMANAESFISNTVEQAMRLILIKSLP
jgi:glycerate 2-kinase